MLRTGLVSSKVRLKPSCRVRVQVSARGVVCWRGLRCRSKVVFRQGPAQQVAQPDAESRVFIEVGSATFGVVYRVGFAGAG